MSWTPYCIPIARCDNWHMVIVFVRLHGTADALWLSLRKNSTHFTAIIMYSCLCTDHSCLCVFDNKDLLLSWVGVEEIAWYFFFLLGKSLQPWKKIALTWSQTFAVHVHVCFSGMWLETEILCYTRMTQKLSYSASIVSLPAGAPDPLVVRVGTRSYTSVIQTELSFKFYSGYKTLQLTSS